MHTHFFVLGGVGGKGDLLSHASMYTHMHTHTCTKQTSLIFCGTHFVYTAMPSNNSASKNHLVCCNILYDILYAGHSILMIYRALTLCMTDTVGRAWHSDNLHCLT